MDRNVLVVIQARMSSSRLPAKAMLNVGGIPAVQLCALRAGNTGQPVVVATSTDASDDALAVCLEKQEIPVVRGPLENVLERFYLATVDCDDDTIVARLTADNVFPDGAFIDACLDQLSDGFSYASTMSQGNPLPYGLVAEFFPVARLRESYRLATTKHDLEHVTPFLRQKYDNCPIEIATDKSYSHLRCTMDYLQDYLRLLRVVENEDVVQVSWRKLCRKLELHSSMTKHAVEQREGRFHPISELSLGTVQLGLKYGIHNATGCPSDATCQNILRFAMDAGVNCWDTAAAYGVSEQRLGRWATDETFVVTKLDPLTGGRESWGALEVEAMVERSVFRSLAHLQRRSLDCLLLHRWAHRTKWNEAVWKTLLKLRKAGWLSALGVSVANPGEALEALRDPDVCLIQIPFNVLDHRWRSPEFLFAREARPDVVVAARSVFLQGLLLAPSKTPPQLESVDFIKLEATIDDWVTQFQRSSRSDLCCAFVRGHDWVDSLVLGCETVEQLQANVELFNKPPLSPEQCERVAASFPDLPLELIDPAQWNR